MVKKVVNMMAVKNTVSIVRVVIATYSQKHVIRAHFCDYICHSVLSQCAIHALAMIIE
jgi:hypothetical protein